MCGPGSSVGILTMGWTVRGSNPDEARFSARSRPALGPTQPPVKWLSDFSPGVKYGRGVLLTTHPF